MDPIVRKSILTKVRKSQKPQKKVLFAKEVALVPDTTFEASQKKVRFAKQVTYISDINFEPSRHQHKYLRGSPRYSAGKHANPDGRAWRNTSFMSDAAYRLRSLKLFEYIDVTSGEQGDKSIDSYNKMMSTGTPLDQMFPNSDTAPLIGDHPLRDAIIALYNEKMAGRSFRNKKKTREDLFRSDGIVVYKMKHEEPGAVAVFHWVYDTYSDADADMFIRKQRKDIRHANLGLKRETVLRNMREGPGTDPYNLRAIL
jgi:hypothetical protein